MTQEAWRKPVGMTNAGLLAARLDGLPPDVGSLAGIVQGLLLHWHLSSAYGIDVGEPQLAEPHIRGVDAMLAHIAAHDARPLNEARAPAERLVAVCRHFTLLHVAMLRRQGIAARARCGFAAYFQEGMFLDHWVSEYWNEAGQRWVMVDAQLDARQRELFRIGFDPCDVPRDQFIVAGQAWRLCRAGKADPDTFAILDLHGMWFIAGNVIRDVAALNNLEMLPWDTWGGMPKVDSEIDTAFIDGLAALTHEPDIDLAALDRAYDDERVAVPSTVFNAVLNRAERL
ncbi:transglutaminase-like domain-containing protein [soil metagenome]